MSLLLLKIIVIQLVLKEKKLKLEELRLLKEKKANGLSGPSHFCCNTAPTCDSEASTASDSSALG